MEEIALDGVHSEFFVSDSAPEDLLFSLPEFQKQEVAWAFRDLGKWMVFDRFDNVRNRREEFLLLMLRVHWDFHNV